MAIILVNLTFADAALRKEMVDRNCDIQLIESLCYTLKVSSMTKEEYEARHPFQVADEKGAYSPKDMLDDLMAEDHSLRPALVDLDCNFPPLQNIDPSRQHYPETSRWCLSALKNLTRPQKESISWTGFISAGIVPVVFRFVKVGTPYNENIRSSQSSSSETPPPSEPYCNSPFTWALNSTQDAALYVILNLAATADLREHIKDIDGVKILSLIADFNDEVSPDEAAQMKLQCLKAVSGAEW